MSAAESQAVIATLKDQIHRNSNASVAPAKGCAIFDSTFGGNAVRVEYKACPPHQIDYATFEDMAVEGFWFAGRFFDLESVSDGQVKSWQIAALEHAIAQGEQDSLSIGINNLEAV